LPTVPRGDLIAAANLPVLFRCRTARQRQRLAAQQRNSSQESGYQAPIPPKRHKTPIRAKPKAGIRRSYGGARRTRASLDASLGP